MSQKATGYNFYQRLSPPKEFGYTLIEVLISLVLVYFISGLALNAITVGAVSLGSSEKQTLAYAYGVSLLEEMKADPECYIMLGQAYSFNSDAAGFLVSKPEGLTAVLEVMPVGTCPPIYRVTICLGYEQGGHPWEVCLLGFVRIDPDL